MADLHFLELVPSARADADAVLANLDTNRQPSAEPQALRRICTSLKAYERKDLLVSLFTELENSTGEIEAARAFVAQFTNCGFNFDEILLDDWYNKPLSRSNLLDPLQRDAASALSTEGGSHGSLLSIAEAVQMGEKVSFSEFNTAACSGTQDAALWDKCTTLFTDQAVKCTLVKSLGGQEKYDEREKVFVEYLLLAICYKYVIFPGSDLDEKNMIQSLVLAQLRLIAHPLKSAVERWDNDCCLFRTMHTLQGNVLIKGYPDLAFKYKPHEDKALIEIQRTLVKSAQKELNKYISDKKADEMYDKAQHAGPFRRKRRLITKKERIDSLRATHKHFRSLYLPTVDFPVEVTIPALNHKTPGIAKTPSFLTSASKQQLGCQLLCLQEMCGFDEPVCGLLTDGCSGTVVLLCSKTDEKDPHRFMRLPVASSPQELFLYCSLISYYSVQKLEEMMLKKWSEEIVAECQAQEGGDPSGGSGGLDAYQCAHGGGDGSGAFSAARQGEGDPREGGTRAPAGSGSSGAAGSGGESSRRTSGNFRTEVNSDDGMSDVSSEPGGDDGLIRVHPSVFETEEGFDSDAEFEYYNNPRRALRALQVLRERALVTYRWCEDYNEMEN